MDKRDERVNFMAKLPRDLHRWLKITAAERGTDMNSVLVDALKATAGHSAPLTTMRSRCDP